MSAVLDFIGDYASDTYDETVDFWTSGHAINDTIDAVKFTIDNPKLMAQTAKAQFSDNVSKFEAASKKDLTKLIILGAIGAYIYFQIKGGK